MHRKGFTLIEMLIVIAIIGILASIVLVGIGPVQRTARDARRASDLRQTQNALELYFSKNAAYPAAGNWAALTTALTSGASAVVRQIPNDPRSGSGATYQYAPDASGNGYVLAATFEDTANSLLTDPSEPDGTVNGVNCADPVYCVLF
jgi:prepilin-type N-terminal cleavage/methylation domain-containing protein